MSISHKFVLLFFTFRNQFLVIWRKYFFQLVDILTHIEDNLHVGEETRAECFRSGKLSCTCICLGESIYGSAYVSLFFIFLVILIFWTFKNKYFKLLYKCFKSCSLSFWTIFQLRRVSDTVNIVYCDPDFHIVERLKVKRKSRWQAGDRGRGWEKVAELVNGLFPLWTWQPSGSLFVLKLTVQVLFPRVVWNTPVERLRRRPGGKKLVMVFLRRKHSKHCSAPVLSLHWDT